MAGALHQSVIGLSGVIFGLVVVDNVSLTNTQRSVFGLFSVPAAAYPWMLLLICQFLIPEVSFLCHLSGLLAGLLWSKGHLQPLCLPGSSLSRFEGSSCPTWLVRHRAFVPCPPGGLPIITLQEAAGGVTLAGLYGRVSTVLQQLWAAFRGAQPPSAVPPTEALPAARVGGRGAAAHTAPWRQPDVNGPASSVTHHAASAAAEAASARAAAAAAAAERKKDVAPEGTASGPGAGGR